VPSFFCSPFLLIFISYNMLLECFREVSPGPIRNPDDWCSFASLAVAGGFGAAGVPAGMAVLIPAGVTVASSNIAVLEDLGFDQSLPLIPEDLSPCPF
jgi:hypothetical protein